MQVLGQFREESETKKKLNKWETWKEARAGGYNEAKKKTELVEKEEVGEVGEVMGTELHGQKVKQQIR